MRKTKGNMVAIFVLLFLSSLLLYLWITLTWDYQQNFPREHDRLNGEHNAFVIAGVENEVDDFIENQMDDDRVSDYSVRETKILDATCPYGENSYRSLFVAMKKETALKANVGKYEILSDSLKDDSDTSEICGVYLPAIFETGGFYKTGDTFTLESGDDSWSFDVLGFYNSTLTSDIHCNMTSIIMTDDAYDELNETPGMKSVLLSVRLNNIDDTELYEYDFENAAESETYLSLIAHNNYNTTYATKYTCVIYAFSIIGVAGIIVLLISLEVVSANIRDFIAKNIKSFGEMKAIGYQSSQLISVISIQFAAICIISILLGTLGSTPVFASFNNMLIALTGINYDIHFYLPAFAITAVSLFVLTMATVLISSSKIRKIPPIAAIKSLRNEDDKPSKILTIDGTSLPLDLILSIKGIFKNKIQSLILFATICAISLGLSFCSFFYISCIKNINEMLEFQVVLADTAVTVSDDDVENFEQYISEQDDVTNVVIFESARHLLCNGEKSLYTYILNDGANMVNSEFLYDGDYSKADNEILLGGRYAKQAKINIGDTVCMEMNDKSAEYTVVGLIQKSTNCGYDCCMLVEGYERLGDITKLTYYVSYDNKEHAAIALKDIEDEFPDATVCNYKSITDGQLKVFSRLLTVLVIGLILLCLFVMTFVIRIFVRMHLENSKNDFGILKAIGYTTTQLTWHTEGCFLPVIIAGFIVGIPIMYNLCNPIFSFLAARLGVVKSSIQFSIPIIVLAAAAMVFYAFVLILIFSARIKRISPHNLLDSE